MIGVETFMHMKLFQVFQGILQFRNFINVKPEGNLNVACIPNIFLLVHINFLS